MAEKLAKPLAGEGYVEDELSICLIGVSLYIWKNMVCNGKSVLTDVLKERKMTMNGGETFIPNFFAKI